VIVHDVPQNSPEWDLLRARGMPTGSEGHRLITATGKPSAAGIKSYGRQLALDMFRGKPKQGFKGNKHTERGHEQEPIAADAYEFIYGKETSKVGFITDDDERYGCSPDRIVEDNGLLEIKCFDEDAHAEALVYYHLNKKAPPDRVAQCQFQLFTTGYDFNDLFFYHETLPELRIRILPVKTYFEMLECQIDDVIEERDAILKILEDMT